MAKAVKKFDPETWTFRIDSEGAITNKKIELFCLYVADDVTRSVAWKLAGYAGNEGGSGRYYRKTINHPLFEQRMKALTDEKEELLADPLFGQTQWMINQMWRQARASGDTNMMAKATDLSWKMTEKRADRSPAAEPTEVGRRAGKPSIAGPSSRVDVSALRDRLVERGLKVGTDKPAPAAEAPRSAPSAPSTPVDFDPGRYVT